MTTCPNSTVGVDTNLPLLLTFQINLDHKIIMKCRNIDY